MATQEAVEERLKWRICGHCGRDDVGSFNGGTSSVGETHLCHPDEPGRPDCYRLVTVYRHGMDCDPCKITKSWSDLGLPVGVRTVSKAPF